MNQNAKTNRACEQCKRKKIRCDGAKPICALCKRVRANCTYPQRKPRAQRRSRSDDRSEDDNISEREIQYTNDQQTIVSNSESGDFAASYMEITDSTRDQGNTSQYDTRGLPGDNMYFPGTPASMGREQSIQYDHTTPTDQDMVDFLTQALPDIWMAEALPQFDLSNPTMTADTNLNFFSLNSTHSQAAANSVPHQQSQKQQQQLKAVDHSQTDHTRVSTESYPFDVPPEVVTDLINLYFLRIQVFIPLFHKPTFNSTYLPQIHQSKPSKESQFVIYGMMSLSARFSTLSYFNDTSPKERGAPFSRKAQTIYQETVGGFEPHEQTLKWLQGCILLAYYNQSCRPAVGCDLMAAVCTRFAYSLGLHKVDEDPYSRCSREEWVCREEQRRAWWSVWELDAFDSISSRRPFSIDKHRMSVFLPVSDEAWWSGSPVESAVLNTDILQCWKSLRDSENRDERAWFLIGNFITVQALELCQQKNVPAKSISDIETVVSCFSLLFHERYGGSMNQLLFDDENYGRSNWLILTRLMIQGGHIASRMLSRKTCNDPRSVQKVQTLSASSVSPSTTHSVTANMSAAIASTPIEDYIQPATEAFRIYQSWSPEYIGFCPPPMVCIITGPAAIMLRFARHLGKVSNAGGDPSHPSIQEDLLILILSKFAKYWNIGLLLLDFVRAF